MSGPFPVLGGGLTRFRPSAKREHSSSDDEHTSSSPRKKGAKRVWPKVPPVQLPPAGSGVGTGDPIVYELLMREMLLACDTAMRAKVAAQLGIDPKKLNDNWRHVMK